MSYIDSLVLMRSFFQTNVTLPVTFRIEQLKKLKAAIKKYESQIFDALEFDLKKSPEETWVTENGFLLSEINHAIKHLSGWVSPQPVPTNRLNFPGRSYAVSEPLGVVLIIGPWNYPFQLILCPLVAAIAAGNCVVLKPSEFATASEKLVQTIIAENFSSDYIQVITGDGKEVIPDMMNHFRFDHVFYTGSTRVGKTIYQMAAKELVPVTLELGGKSPVVIDADANITVAAKRIAMAKYSNAGQMCVAPDYVLVHQSVVQKFLYALKQTVIVFFGNDPSRSYDYGKIINQNHFQRLLQYLQYGNVYSGGGYREADLYIEPAILYPVNLEDAFMQEEIFGPLLPVISYSTDEEALAIIRRNDHPLAAYVFSSNSKRQQFWLQNIHSGGACVNTVSLHLTNPSLPFGGRGNSGIGKYHGKYGFDTFSHLKAVLKMPAWPDPSIRYPTYKGKLFWFKKIIGG